jgi:hypothetical protein
MTSAPRIQCIHTNDTFSFGIRAVLGSGSLFPLNHLFHAFEITNLQDGFGRCRPQIDTGVIKPFKSSYNLDSSRPEAMVRYYLFISVKYIQRYRMMKQRSNHSWNEFVMLLIRNDMAGGGENVHFEFSSWFCGIWLADRPSDEVRARTQIMV